MNRLTFVDEKGRVLFTPKGCNEDIGYTIIQLAEGGHVELLNDIAERLANCEQSLQIYQDLEEQGKLLKLPCKIGEPVYYIQGHCEGIPKEAMFVDRTFFNLDMLSKIGTEFFLTQEQAEVALKEMKDKG